MIRSERYKLILYPEVPAARLFDLQTDPLEINDISNQAEYANTAKVLFGQLLELQRKMDDTLRLEGRYPLLQE
jgi:hypothetical protein